MSAPPAASAPASPAASPPPSQHRRRYGSAQPNIPGRGIVAGYSPAFWGLVVVIGLFSGAVGAALMEFLFLIQRLAFGYRHGSFLTGVLHASDARRVLVLLAAGAIAGVGALLLGRMRSFGGAEVTEAVWREGGEMALAPSVSRGVLSEIVIGMGASLGREAAPQVIGAAGASRLCALAGVPRWQRRLLVACGGAAGMAAVYNVPLGGALFALEVLLGTLALPLVLPALLTSLIATAVAWVVLGNHATYAVPHYGVHATQIFAAAVIGPLAGLAAVAWVRLVALANRLRQGRAVHFKLLAPLLALTVLGALAIPYPQLLGNGKDTVQLALLGGIGLATLVPLLVLKPLLTAGCLGSGTPGGLFTPTLAYGVLVGALLGHAWNLIWPGAGPGSYALIGGGAVLAASMQGPLSAVVLMLELAPTQSLMVPVLLAVAGATIVSRMLGAPSLYSARLGSEGETSAHPGVHQILDELDEAPQGAG